MISGIKEKTKTIELTPERLSFIRNVYGHVFFAMLLFIGISYALIQSGIAVGIANAISGRWLLTLGAFMLVGWGASHLAHRAKSVTAQYGALIGMVIAQAIIFTPMLVILAFRSDPGLIASVGYVTAAAFAVLTAIVWFSKKNFSFLRGFLMYGGFIALGLIVVSILVPSVGLGIWFSGAMALFAGVAIMYDTSNILHNYPADRAPAAALELFSSIALLLWYVAQIFISQE